MTDYASGLVRGNVHTLSRKGKTRFVLRRSGHDTGKWRVVMEVPHADDHDSNIFLSRVQAEAEANHRNDRYNHRRFNAVIDMTTRHGKRWCDLHHNDQLLLCDALNYCMSRAYEGELSIVWPRLAEPECDYLYEPKFEIVRMNHKDYLVGVTTHNGRTTLEEPAFTILPQRVAFYSPAREYAEQLRKARS